MQTQDIIIVKNPFSNKSVNIKPLFQTMFDLGENGNDNTIRDFRKSIEDIARFIALHTERSIIQDSPESFQHHCFILYQLADALDKIENF